MSRDREIAADVAQPGASDHLDNASADLASRFAQSFPRARPASMVAASGARIGSMSGGCREATTRSFHLNIYSLCIYLQKYS